MASQHSKTKAGSTSSLNQKLQDENSEMPVEALDHPAYEELQKQLTEMEEKAAENWDRFVRLQAEVENTQRRVERDIANAHKYGLEKFTLELLPIVDSLELALSAHGDEKNSTDGLLDGVQLTLKMLHKAFEKFGIEQIDPESQPFNPEFHQAVSIQQDASVKSNTILKVLQKGYLLNGRLMRPAMVIVAKN